MCLSFGSISLFVWLLSKCEKECENLAILLTFKWLIVCRGEYHVVITLKMKIQSHIVCKMPKIVIFLTGF
jgi:hypothetical protein